MKKFFVSITFIQMILSCSSTIFGQNDENHLKYNRDIKVNCKNAKFYFKLIGNYKEEQINYINTLSNEIENLFRRSSFIIAPSKKECDILVTVKFKNFQYEFRNFDDKPERDPLYIFYFIGKALESFVARRHFSYTLILKYIKRKPKKYVNNVFLEQHIKVSSSKDSPTNLTINFNEILKILSINSEV